MSSTHASPRHPFAQIIATTHRTGAFWLAVCLSLLCPPTRAADWGRKARAPEGAPNIVLILLDDVGFSDPDSLGGVARTPAFSRVARDGALFTNFNTTGMCSPTRASLLSGRNHHAVGFGRVADWATGTPGYNAVWKPEAASIARVLKDHGYSTAAIGKWHNTPEWEVSPAGPFDRWPTGLGFEYFYGIMNHGGDNQWEPASLYRDTTPVEPEHVPGREYHLTSDFVDQAITWLRTREAAAPDKPYFLYLATGAVHAPHHVPRTWIDQYRGRFDQGWDVLRREIFARQKRLGLLPANAELTARPAEIPAWDSLTPDQRRVFARQMEVFAAYLAHTDHEIGRLLDAVRGAPDGDNTIIVYVAGDNGASGMEGIHGHMDATAGHEAQLAHLDELGGPLHFNDYSSAWAWVGSTPFQWMKEVASHFGGLRVGMAVSWPARFAAQAQPIARFSHANDVVPTLLEAIGIALPERVDGIVQRPLDGVSLLPLLDGKTPPPAHRVQYFEMLGNRALYQDGWIASARHMTPWIKPYPEGFDTDRWELYDLEHDFSQAHDLAARYPEKLAAMKRRFDEEARRNQVFPLANYVEGADHGAPSLSDGRTRFDFVPPLPRLPTKSLPRLPRSSFRFTAEVEVDDGAAAEGMLAAYGSRLGGFAWYLRDGRPTFANNVYGRDRAIVSTDRALSPGPHRLALDFQRDDTGTGGVIRLHVDDEMVAQRRVARLGSSVLGSFGVGRAYTSPISDDYALPFAFNGALRRLTLQLR